VIASFLHEALQNAAPFFSESSADVQWPQIPSWVALVLQGEEWGDVEEWVGVEEEQGKGHTQ
jgi:hypothetical protein